jgi:molecular chaperone HtpG
MPTDKLSGTAYNNINMDRSVISSHLMKVGASFYNTPQFQQEYKDYTPISRFGIGILTNFMISDDIEIITCKAGVGYRIRLTSVQSDYLLKKIDPSDSLLKGIEPHGTRITVKIRSSVEFKEKSMIDIVRYWIVLPECDVYFCEENKPPELIGFKTAAEALQYYHKKSIDDDNYSFTNYSTEVRSTLLSTEKGKYEFAYKVKKGFTPEWRFADAYVRDAPVVCIEGIRADNSLPGFSGFSRPFMDPDIDYEFEGRSVSLCTLLSVRGNKDFRTTVSRSSLEKDQEYVRVGKICADFFMKHMVDEISRIAQMAGFPLSRASSAGQWIYKSIVRIVDEKTVAYLNDEYVKVPIIVIEKIKAEDEPPQVSRELISSKGLDQVYDFWTIESRLVSYLGTISRDLGKELSLNEFLGTLAPEFRDPRITALIPDAFEFKREILKSHIVEKVEFSRSNQQTMVHWIPRKSNYVKIEYPNGVRTRTISENLHNELVELLPEASLRGDRNVLYQLEQLVFLTLHETQIAPIEKGDIEAIRGINTQIVTILDERTSLAKIWRALSNFIEEHLLDEQGTEEYYWAVLAIASLAGTFSKRGGLQDFFSEERYIGRTYWSSHGTRVNKRARELWNESVKHVNRILVGANANLALVIETDLVDLIGDTDNWFDASQYWWNWFGEKSN